MGKYHHVKKWVEHMPKVIKFWHQWSWLYHVVWTAVVVTGFIVTYQNSIASNTADIKAINDEKLPERMAVQEQISRDVKDNLADIKTVQGKIFERINQLADRRHE